MSQTRALITIQGRVQGVGFRPFVYRLAHQHGLLGTISNTSMGVQIDVQGDKSLLSRFQQDIVNQKPPGATIIDFSSQEAPLSRFTSFTISPSESHDNKSLALLPDTALCEECLKELFDPQNRRHQYPFLHCISCGPRFSLFLGMPFDRDRTTMREFSMCSECQQEYADPTNRRFYSQTNCCPNCGPQLQFLDSAGTRIAGKEEALASTAQALLQGKIVAMKNTGGYLLLVDATNEEAVQRLRLKKRRLGKPFALLMPSLEAADKVAYLSDMERNLLASPAAPIVLLNKKKDFPLIAPSVSHKSLYHGIMLPHNPLQHLLLHRINNPLVATSGNLSGGPLCITEQEALATLSSVADYFLVHNRRINHRLDDSIVQVINDQPTVMRKARGYIPCAFPVPSTKELFAAGSQMKNSFAFLKQGYLYMSQHVGDLDSAGSCRAYENEIASWEPLLGIQKPEAVGDKHPGFYSNAYLKKRGFPSTTVQHHEAHVWAGMLDNKLSPPFLGIAWDGTGWGDDATVWGGEAFLATKNTLSRVASLYPFRLPGGEKAVREPRRSLLGLLHALYGTKLRPDQDGLVAFMTEEEFAALTTALTKKINSPLCSSIGRLFDAVSALLGLCLISDFEGEAAMLLEKAATQATGDPLGKPMPFLKQGELLIWDHRPMIAQLLEGKGLGIPSTTLALTFHKNLALSIVELAKAVGERSVLLTGGVMQNKLLVELTTTYLKAAGFKPYTHREIPPNDGGLAVGQLIAATHYGVLTYVPSLAW